MSDLARHLESSTELRKGGEHLGRYEILFPIASGGMATVYAARVKGTGAFQKPVVLKVMLPHLARDEHFCSMFMDEATLAAHIQSPHVVATLDLGRDENVLYMAMELILGATLRELQSGGRLDPSVAATILVECAMGLHDAHEAKDARGAHMHLVHRDVSPHNVLVGVDGRTRISDFGVARAIHTQAHTRTGELRGKLSYFSPEQLDAVDDLDRRSDVFSLGIVAWETFAGRRLFAAPNPLALATLIAHQTIERLDRVADVPRPIADIVERALARDRDRRLPSAEAFAAALRTAADATCGLASHRAVGEAVRGLGGDRVRTLERRVQRSMSEPSPSFTTDSLPALSQADAQAVLASRTEPASAGNARSMGFGIRSLAVAAVIGLIGGVAIALRPSDESAGATEAAVDAQGPMSDETVSPAGAASLSPSPEGKAETHDSLSASAPPSARAEEAQRGPTDSAHTEQPPSMERLATERSARRARALKRGVRPGASAPTMRNSPGSSSSSSPEATSDVAIELPAPPPPEPIAPPDPEETPDMGSVHLVSPDVFARELERRR